jgi:hypothetical protein
VTERVWVPAVTRNVIDRVLIPDRFEDREEVEYVGRHRVVEHHRVLVCRAHYEEVSRQVEVCCGHFEDQTRQVCLTEGHWQNVCRQELVAAGHWDDRREVRDVSFDRGYGGRDDYRGREDRRDDRIGFRLEIGDRR